MDRYGFLAVLLLIFFVSDVSDAFRRLNGEAPNTNTTVQQQISPSPSSGSSGNTLDLNTEHGNKTDEKDKKIVDQQVPDNSSVVNSQVPDNSSVVNSQVPNNSSVDDSQVPKNSSVVDSQVSSNSSVVDSQVSSNSSVVDPKGLDDKGSPSPSPTVKNDTDTSSVNPSSSGKERDDKKKDQIVNKDDNKPPPEQEIRETCDGLPDRCTDGGSLHACIQHFESGSKELVLLVQNIGEKTLKVSLANSASVESATKELQIPKLQSRKINISIDVSKSNKIIFNAGSGQCVLLVAPVLSEDNFFLRLPSFDNLVTPVNGAYFLILAGVIFGATWACCKCRKTKRHDGIPYQELEMGLPESVSATNVETAEGWDQGWDDDWDEDNAVKSPVRRAPGSISANGLSARSPSKEGWDNDWDD